MGFEVTDWFGVADVVCVRGRLVFGEDRFGFVRAVVRGFVVVGSLAVCVSEGSEADMVRVRFFDQVAVGLRV